jgi:hypothetical protein
VDEVCPLETGFKALTTCTDNNKEKKKNQDDWYHNEDDRRAVEIGAAVPHGAIEACHYDTP